MSNLLVFLSFIFYFSKYQCTSHQLISVDDFIWRANHEKSHLIVSTKYFFFILILRGGEGLQPGSSHFGHVPIITSVSTWTQFLQPRRWTQHIPPKCWYQPTRQHAMRDTKTIICTTGNADHVTLYLLHSNKPKLKGATWVLFWETSLHTDYYIT
jgi:hypothetical protein